MASRSATRHARTHSSTSSPRRPYRWCSRTTDVLILVSGDPSRRTGGNVYDAHVVAAARRAGLCVAVVSVGSVAAAERAVARRRPRLVVVDSIAFAHAPTVPEATRLLALAHMSVPRAALPDAHTVVAVSRALARRLGGAGAVVIRPGRDGVPRAPRRRVDGPPRLLCVANWSAAKGIDVLLRALEHVDGVALDLVGDTRDGAYARRVRSLLGRPRLRGRVHVHGALRVAALSRRYAEADAAVVPSRTEGYGIALAEALHAGLPAVASDLPALREVAAEAALFVAPDRVRALAAALRALRDPRRRALLARRATTRAARLPTWTATERSWARLLRREVRAAARPRPAAAPGQV